MTRRKHRTRMVALIAAMTLAGSPTATVAQTRARAAASTAAAAPDDDARRAAAARLLAASRFRGRQAVLIKDTLRAAESEMAQECLDRAVAGQSMKTCEAIAAPAPALKARLAAAESDMLDEVMAASQTTYARKFTAEEMDEITRFFRTPVGQHYSQLYPQVLTEVQQRNRAIARRYLTAAAAASGAKAP